MQYTKCIKYIFYIDVYYCDYSQSTIYVECRMQIDPKRFVLLASITVMPLNLRFT